MVSGALVLLLSLVGRPATAAQAGLAPSVGHGLNGYVRDILEAKKDAGDSYQVYLWRATTLTESALQDQDWAAAKASLIKQGAKLKTSSTGWGDYRSELILSNSDFTLPSGKVLPLSIRLSIEPLTSPVKASRLRIRGAYVAFDLEIKDSVAELRNWFAEDTVLAKLLARPKVVREAGRYPRVRRVRLEYRLVNIPRGTYRVPSKWPHGFDASLDLEKGPAGVESGINLSYFAPSELDPLINEEFKPILEGYARRDEVGDLTPDYPTDEAAPSEETYRGLSDQYIVIERVGTSVPWREPEAYAFAKGDLLTLSAQTKSMALNGTHFEAGDLEALTRFKRLEVLDLSGLITFPDVDWTVIGVVGKLRSLRELFLPSAIEGAPPADLVRSIAALPRMQRITSRADLGAEQFKILAAMPRLTEFDVAYCKGVKDDSLQPLWKNRHLTKLLLSETSSLGVGTLKGMAGMTHLRHLSFGPIAGDTEVALLSILQRNSLKYLALTGVPLTPKVLQAIARHRSLRRLTLESCPGLDDVSIQVLGQMPAIDMIYFQKCPGVTRAGAGRLKSALKGTFELG
ncbi:MAG: F-box and leucine-rich repeat protein 7 [Fimbriimonadaceae bacterium]|nr:F-box and leucine-rich repeat protein 7 [Fimbriimonadaceae bacterium]